MPETPSDIEPSIPSPANEEQEKHDVLERGHLEQEELEVGVLPLVAENPDVVANRVEHAVGTRMYRALKTQQDGNIDRVRDIRDRMSAAELPPSVEKELDAILEGLEDPFPDGDEVPRNNRYLGGRMMKPKTREPFVSHEVNFAKVREDQAFLEKIAGTHPGLASDARAIQSMLEGYANADPRFSVQKMYEYKSRSYTGKALGKMGQMTLVIGATAAAILTGVVSIFNKNFSATPFLYAGLTALVASPALRRSLFQKEHQQVLDEIASVNDDEFRRITKSYGVQGKEWRDAMEMFEEDDGKEFLKKLKGNTAKQEDIDAFVADAFPGDENDPAVGSKRDSLRQMIANKNDFIRLTNTIATPKNKDAREVIFDSIEFGTSQLGKDMRAIEQAKNAFEEGQEKQT